MPYIVINGEVHDGTVYRLGEFVPGSKGSRAAQEAVGADKWLETTKKPEAAPPAVEQPKPAAKPPAKRKAVKR